MSSAYTRPGDKVRVRRWCGRCGHGPWVEVQAAVADRELIRLHDQHMEDRHGKRPDVAGASGRGGQG